ncbi:MAG: DUF3857 and transglutaminase domain-containing protein [Bacteroidales bacterium]
MRSSLLFAFLAWGAGPPVLAQVDALVVEHATEIVVEEAGRTVTRSYVIQVNDKAADWLGEIEIPFQEGDEVEILAAEITDTLGNVLRRVKKADMTTSSDLSGGAFFQDDYVKEFNMKWDRVPYRIHYSYRIRESQYLYVAAWTPYVEPDVPVRRATLRVEVPAGMELQRRISSGIGIRESEDRQTDRMDYEVSGLPALTPERDAPPVWESIPRVMLLGRDFLYGVAGSSDSWQTFGQWIWELNRDLDELPDRDRQEADRLLSGVTDPREKAGLLYRYLQENTRYINVSLDIGGLKSHPASYVSQKGYGDCKALTTYMMALLRYAGIPSHRVLVYAGSNPRRVDPGFPGQQFNHVILCVPLENDTLWLENTSQSIPPGYLGPFTQGRLGLLVDETGSRLVPIPALRVEDVGLQRSFEFRLTREGDGMAVIRMEGKGSYRDRISNLVHEGDREGLESYARGLCDLRQLELTSLADNDTLRGQETVSLEVKGHIAGQLRQVGRRKAIDPPPLDLPRYETPAKRTREVRIAQPVHLADSVVYRVAGISRYHILLPQDKRLETSFGHYEVSFERQEDLLLVRRDFVLLPGVISLEEYPLFHAFLEQVERMERQNSIALTPN